MQIVAARAYTHEQQMGTFCDPMLEVILFCVVPVVVKTRSRPPSLAAPSFIRTGSDRVYHAMVQTC